MPGLRAARAEIWRWAKHDTLNFNLSVGLVCFLDAAPPGNAPAGKEPLRSSLLKLLSSAPEQRRPIPGAFSRLQLSRLRLCAPESGWNSGAPKAGLTC